MKLTKIMQKKLLLHMNKILIQLFGIISITLKLKQPYKSFFKIFQVSIKLSQNKLLLTFFIKYVIMLKEGFFDLNKSKLS